MQIAAPTVVRARSGLLAGGTMGVDGDLEQVEQPPRIAVGASASSVSQAASSTVTGAAPGLRPAGPRRAPPPDAAQSLLVQGPQDVDAAAGEESAVDLEGGVLGGRADQGDQPGLHVRKKRILLGPVEAVDFVDEETACADPRRPTFRARSTTARTSFTPESTAENCS